MYPIVLCLFLILFCQFLNGLISNYLQYKIQCNLIIIKNNYTLMVLEKALKIKLLSPKPNFTGNLINLVQQDCIRFYSNGFAIFYFFWTIIYLLTIVGICFWLLGKIFAVYLLTGFTLMITSIRLYKRYSIHSLDLQKERDNRIN